MTVFDSNTRQKGPWPFKDLGVKKNIITDDILNPTKIYEMNQAGPWSTVSIVLHNTSTVNSVRVTLRHISFIDNTAWGTAKDQFFSRSLDPDETVRVSLGQVIPNGDWIAALATVDITVSAHVYYEYPS